MTTAPAKSFALSPLTDAQLAHYREHGYVMLGPIMDDATLESLRNEEARFRRTKSNELTVFRAHLLPHSLPLRDFCLRGAQIEIAKQLVGPNLALFWNQMVTKFPDGDSGKSEFPWHQDSGYVEIQPHTALTIWMALDDVDEQNGCVWVMPKSHLNGLLPHEKSPGSTHLKVNVAGDGAPARLKAGEAIAFSGLTLHRSKLNHTDRVRRAFFIEYVDADSTYRMAGDERKPVISMPDVPMVCGEAKML